MAAELLVAVVDWESIHGRVQDNQNMMLPQTANQSQQQQQLDQKEQIKHPQYLERRENHSYRMDNISSMKGREEDIHTSSRNKPDVRTVKSQDNLSTIALNQKY